MREVVDRARVEQVMAALADAADRDVDVYFTGGASAVLIGWRPSTVDIDLVAVPDSGAMMRAVPAIKERLAVNVEYASPAHFIPVPDGWPERSTFIAQIGRVRFHHFDFYAQALSKIERRHTKDREDVREMVSRRLVDPARAREYFREMEPELYRFPAIDPASFRRAVDDVLAGEPEPT